MSNSCNIYLSHVLKVHVLASLMIGITVCTQAQEVWPADTLCHETDTIEEPGLEPENHGEALCISDSGDIVVVRGCSAVDLARFLNTTPAIARAILEEQDYAVSDDDSIVLIMGDTLRCVDTDAPASTPPRGMGGIIYRHSGNNLGKLFFSNYWQGGTDIVLSNSQFAEILICIKQYQVLLIRTDTLSSDNSLTACIVSFYNTPYERVFGSATVYIDSEQRIVGFSDCYNFDTKNRGARPSRYEFYVRLVSLFSPSTAASFEICY